MRESARSISVRGAPAASSPTRDSWNIQPTATAAATTSRRAATTARGREAGQGQERGAGREDGQPAPAGRARAQVPAPLRRIGRGTAQQRREVEEHGGQGQDGDDEGDAPLCAEPPWVQGREFSTRLFV